MNVTKQSPANVRAALLLCNVSPPARLQHFAASLAYDPIALLKLQRRPYKRNNDICSV